MSITYQLRSGNSNELRKRAARLISGPSYPSEVQNNVAMLTNLLGHSLLDIADLMDRVHMLENPNEALR